MPSEYPSDWDSRRKSVYARDKFQCQNCGAGGGPNGSTELHAHHIVPKSKGGTHQRSNLVTMCKSCHNTIHKNSSQKKTQTGNQSSKRDKIRAEQKEQLQRIKNRQNPPDGFTWSNFADSSHTVPCPYCEDRVRNRRENFVSHWVTSESKDSIPEEPPENLMIPIEDWREIRKEVNKKIQEAKQISEENKTQQAEATFPWLDYQEDKWRVPCPECQESVHNARSSFLTHWKESGTCPGPSYKLRREYDIDSTEFGPIFEIKRWFKKMASNLVFD